MKRHSVSNQDTTPQRENPLAIQSFTSDTQTRRMLSRIVIEIPIMCRDIFWVESFNHQLLTYISKRIGACYYGLGTLRWLINYVWLYILSFFYYRTTERECTSTSERLVQDMRIQDMRRCMSKKKSRLSEKYGRITFNREKLTSGTAIYISNLEHCIIIWSIT